MFYHLQNHEKEYIAKCPECEMNNVSFSFVLSCNATSFGAYKAMFCFASGFYYKINVSIFRLVEDGIDRAEICLVGHILAGHK